MSRHLQRGQPKGQEHSQAKLTEDQVREILRRLAAGERQQDLAEAFGVTPSNVSHIKRGVSWAHLGGAQAPQRLGSQRPSAKLTERDVPVILRRVENGESMSAVARAFGVGRTTISDIWHGRRWAHVPRTTRRTRRRVYEDLY